MRTIKIPKVDENKFYAVKVYKTKIFNQGIFDLIYLQPQIIAGIKIPKDSTIKAISGNIQPDGILDAACVLGIELNKLLRFVYLEQLRNNK